MKKRQSSASVLAVVGAGAWGTAISVLQASNFERVKLFTREADAAEEITRFHTNSRYLDDARVPANVFATTCLEHALEGAETVVVAVPSHVTRDVASRVIEAMEPRARVVLATKGLERGTGLLSLEVWRLQTASALAPGRRAQADPLVLSGPNLALEISRGLPAVSSLGGTDPAAVRRAVADLEHPLLSLVGWHDPLGAQAAGALKNVYAVGCGMAVARGWGHNATAALVWRGLDETARFVRAVGGDPGVVATPAGVGDFIATCTSPLSRNHDLGRMVSGRSAGNEEVRGVREGAQTAAEAMRRGREVGVCMPLLEAVAGVLCGSHKPEAVLEAACRSREGAAPAPGAGEHARAMMTVLSRRPGVGVAGE